MLDLVGNPRDPFSRVMDQLYLYVLLHFLSSLPGVSHIIGKPKQRFFSSVKMENFIGKKIDIFNIFAQNIDCGYTLEPPLRGGYNISTHNLCFGSQIRKKCIPR